MKKIVILFTTSHPDTLGNACRLVLAQYVATNYDAWFVTNQVDFISKTFNTDKVVEIKSNKVAKTPIISDYVAWRSTAKLINRLNPSLIFLFNEDSAVSNWLNTPVVQYIHQHGQRSLEGRLSIKSLYRSMIGKFRDRFYYEGMRKSDALFVVSPQIISLFKEKKIQSMYHIPHAIELKTYTSSILSPFHDQLKKLKEDGCFIVAYTGWVTETRGFRLMIESVRKAVSEGAKIALVIAGADEQFSKKIKEFNVAHNMEENIVNYGVIDVSLIPGILYYADAAFSFLDDLPAFKISPPQKVIEYFAAGVPVICNSIETHLSLVEHEKTGLITDYDVDSVFHALMRIYDDPELKDRLSHNALIESKKYEIDAVYSKMVDTMNTIIHDNENGGE